MQKILTPAERLIVAADFKPRLPQGRNWAKAQILRLADILKGTKVVLKINSDGRAWGYNIIREIQSRGLRVFIDFKVYDIGATLSRDGFLLAQVKPEIVTVACISGVSAMRALKAELPDTEVLGVTVLTTHKEADTETMFRCGIKEAVLRFAQLAADARIDGLICAPKEVSMLRAKFGSDLSLNTPGIRSMDEIIIGDDQNPDRAMTATEAIKAGADRIVVGRPITEAKNPYDATMRFIDQIASATA